MLLLKENYKHRYPYDWRTKKPTIFRATEQWFASVNGFRSSALKAIEDVEWMPSTGKNRIYSMVVGRGDWCIARQRSWGVPIPAFFKKNGIKFYMTADKRYFNNCGLPIEKPNFLNEDEELKILNEEIKKEIEDKKFKELKRKLIKNV